MVLVPMESHTVCGGDSVMLHVDEVGTGRPVLFIHGYSQSRLAWRKQLHSDLRNDMRLVAMDNRGHGRSEKPHNAYGNSRQWAEDVRSVLTALDLDDVVLVGWSYAGLIVLDYIERYGTDNVSAINLVGAVSAIGTDAATAVLDSGYIDLVSGFVSEDAEESVDTMRNFVQRCVHEDLPTEDFYYMLGYSVTVPPYVRDGLRDRTVTHDMELSELDVPVLLTHGEEDAVVNPEATRTHAELIENVETSFYPNTGHSPFWEKPTRFNSELREFVIRGN